MSLKTWIKTLTLAVAIAGTATSAQAQQFFRIGTGGTAGTYYPIGGMIANAVSQPGKLIATAAASNGSVANINGILGGSFESGFTQSDVAYWAYNGSGTFEGKPKAQDLRLVATLYPESIHLVTRKGSGIKSVADLRGKRVSMDEPGSGTLVDVRLILGAYGMTDKDVKAEYLKPNQAGDKIKDGGLDAFFFVGGAPAGAIAELASSAGIEIVPLVGPEIDKLRADQQFFTPDIIPANTYQGVGETKTISVNAQMVTSAKQPEETVYEIVKAMYSDPTQKTLAAGHTKGKLINKENAVKGADIPFHSGDEKYYKEAGLLK
ncbi:TAXI family TRAP transporter solute-binding subunit [Bordetella holmesii]|uniref:TRAP transporter solute receptor, TAXI family n=2 Tax=Bordetella holmesii TaxID=35814 RepID=A0A158MAM7_9BORD|nr:TAXI family TRAP transporter solute-binding subunit [Bordetella holmesii]AHV91723.1 TRAP transporter solute receptor, TAXI family protein [Bordetella holmesii ATCC 51541]AIT26160.1 TRAP transporter solute receptor, TAXI family protein [Bordetella holmesii 44057]EWM41640.1 TRAP transporter solute receptor, TAXI family protein [Bordetella holmesii 41130]EWM46731.1 TRAP transporter solute receptor, TAXI family protein [Bordetella holmesii 35009]EWM50898.1 TRAP transporter solute receptor, TAXI